MLAAADPVAAGIDAAVAEARTLLGIAGVAGVNLSGMASDRGTAFAAAVQAEIGQRLLAEFAPMTEEMEAEFDTLAEWTAEVALDLGPDYFLPAGCRGSGRPAALRWLIDRLEITAADRMLDCGAGVGGPAGFAAQETGVRPVLSEPQAGACRAARRLFGLPTVQAGSELPFAAGSFDVVWSLGVLCTVDDQPLLLARAAPGARAGRAAGPAGLRRPASPVVRPSRPGTTFPPSTGCATCSRTPDSGC